jgi:hypothetical protein
MHEFMKSGLFGIFILGVALCALSTISAVVVFLVETPLFSTQQIERLAGVGLAFCAGVLACVLCALASAALEYADKSGVTRNVSRRGKELQEEDE